MRNIVIALTGASGAIYGKLLLSRLQDLSAQWNQVAVVLTDNAKLNWELELSAPYQPIPDFLHYKNDDFFAPFASGSAKYDTMIIIPASMGTVGRIANGISTGLITRAADVMLKERRKLIIVPRESPLSLIHLQNLTRITEAGGIICPANPSFYSQPKTIDEVAMTVVNRVLSMADFESGAFQWGL